MHVASKTTVTGAWRSGPYNATYLRGIPSVAGKKPRCIYMHNRAYFIGKLAACALSLVLAESSDAAKSSQ